MQVRFNLPLCEAREIVRILQEAIVETEAYQASIARPEPAAAPAPASFAALSDMLAREDQYESGRAEDGEVKTDTKG